MRADLVLIGNDVHRPLQEMAAHLTENLRAAAELPAARIVSLQSRKALTSAGETVVRKRFGRALQLASLLVALRRFPRSAALVYIGNGNRALIGTLALFAKLRGQPFVLYPMGSVALPPLLKPDWLWVPHEQLCEHYRREGFSPTRLAVMPPFSGTLARQPRRWQGGRLLFASVPPHATEFGQRGLPLLFEGVRLANDLGINVSLTVLNRYAHLHAPLAALITHHRCDGLVQLRSEVIEGVAEFLDPFDLIVAPSGQGALPQVPLSAVEGLTLGIPVIAATSLALGSDLHRYQAGALFDDSKSFVEAIRTVRDSFERHSAGALRLAGERYSREFMLNTFSASCASLREQ